MNRLLVEDRKAGPAETAAARMDLAAWFGTLTKRNRKIAKALALGEPTAAAAKKFGISPGRISQLRTGSNGIGSGSTEEVARSARPPRTNSIGSTLRRNPACTGHREAGLFAIFL